MSMTREEAIAEIERLLDCAKKLQGPQTFVEFRPAPALEMALSALRPVSREQVEKAWRGKWLADRESELTGFDYALAGCDPVIGYACSRCKTNAALDCNGEFVLDNFCPVCGAPMTDEAVEMMTERMEAISE